MKESMQRLTLTRSDLTLMSVEGIDAARTRKIMEEESLVRRLTNLTTMEQATTSTKPWRCDLPLQGGWRFPHEVDPK